MGGSATSLIGQRNLGRPTEFAVGSTLYVKFSCTDRGACM